MQKGRGPSFPLPTPMVEGSSSVNEVSISLWHERTVNMPVTHGIMILDVSTVALINSAFPLR